MARSKVFIDRERPTKRESKQMSTHSWAQFGYGVGGAASNQWAEKNVKGATASNDPRVVRSHMRNYEAKKGIKHELDKGSAEHKKAYNELRMKGVERSARKTLGGKHAPKNLSFRYSAFGNPLAEWGRGKGRVTANVTTPIRSKPGTVKIKQKGKSPYYYRMVKGKKIRVKKGKRK